jgi:hypothetical protein
VIDNRTGKSIQVPIEHNAIPATALKKLAVKGVQAAGSAPDNRPEDELEAGIRVYDPGYACPPLPLSLIPSSSSRKKKEKKNCLLTTSHCPCLSVKVHEHRRHQESHHLHQRLRWRTPLQVCTTPSTSI